jgi:AcrR family transcriptional regulator
MQALPALQRRSRDKRDRLLEAGLHVFGSVGYDAARVADIARAAGISVGVFYQRFRDKRALFSALEDAFVSRAAERTSRFLANADPAWSATELCERLLGEVARVMRANVGFFRGLVTLAHRDGGVVGPGAELDARTAAALYALLVERKLIRRRVSERDVRFALSSATKVLLVHALLRGGGVRAARGLPAHARLDIRELALMMCRYLDSRD